MGNFSENDNFNEFLRIKIVTRDQYSKIKNFKRGYFECITRARRR